MLTSLKHCRPNSDHSTCRLKASTAPDHMTSAAHKFCVTVTVWEVTRLASQTATDSWSAQATARTDAAA